jgi:Zn-finger nucleic acid-binding protein
MKCPRGHGRLRARRLGSVEFHRCPECGGAFYDARKLRLLKRRASHGDYGWIHIDLWKDEAKFRAGKQERLVCPNDKQTMVTVRYGDSRVRVDICEGCRGIWLDEREYGKILRYLEQKVDSETVAGYLDDMRREFVDAIKHPARAGEDISDIGKILHLLELRFIVQHPRIANTLRTTARGIPGT